MADPLVSPLSPQDVAWITQHFTWRRMFAFFPVVCEQCQRELWFRWGWGATDYHRTYFLCRQCHVR